MGDFYPAQLLHGTFSYSYSTEAFNMDFAREAANEWIILNGLNTPLYEIPSKKEKYEIFEIF